MFPLDEIQRQGDKDFQIPDDFTSIHFQNSQYLKPSDLEDLKFLDTYLEGNELSTIDCQDINFSMEPTEESMNLSSLIDFTCDFSSNMPVQEPSCDLNSIPELADLNFWNSSDVGQNSSSLQVPSVTEEISCENIAVSPGMQMPLSNDSEETIYESRSSETLFLDGEKYREMRRKNNIASQRSRRMRKQKDADISEQLKKLEKENAELSLLYEKLKKERDTLQKYFLKFVAKK